MCTTLIVCDHVRYVWCPQNVQLSGNTHREKLLFMKVYYSVFSTQLCRNGILDCEHQITWLLSQHNQEKYFQIVEGGIWGWVYWNRCWWFMSTYISLHNLCCQLIGSSFTDINNYASLMLESSPSHWHCHCNERGFPHITPYMLNDFSEITYITSTVELWSLNHPAGCSIRYNMLVYKT